MSERMTAMMTKHRDVVTRSLRRFGVPDADVDDAAQQAFCVLARRLDRVPPGKERPFLFGVALRIARANGRERQGRSEVSGSEVLDAIAADVPGPDDQLDDARARARLDVVLGEMPGELRDVFVLHELESMTMAEIASAEGLRPGTVASRLRRARATFARAVLGALLALVAFARRSAAAALLAPIAVAVALVLRASPTPTPTPTPPKPAPITIAVPPVTPTARTEELAAPPAPKSRPAAAKPRAVLSPEHEDEVTLLHRAKKLLADGNVDAARTTLAERDRHFPRGALGAESDVLRIELLVASGDAEGARRAADAFVVRHPNSPYEQRVRSTAAR